MTPVTSEGVLRYGLVWNGLNLLRHLVSKWPRAELRLRKDMVEVEMRRFLIGEKTMSVQFNTIRDNAATWGDYDWSYGGDEWTDSAEWKQALVEEVMFAYVQPDSVVVEIGPGSGRWSEHLQRRARRLILVDVAQPCLDLCRERFAGATNVELRLTSGNGLDFLSENEIDHIWSFDVFVHINPTDINSYLRSMRRVLKPGGCAVIHHAKEGIGSNGWRSAMTDEFFAYLVGKNGLRLVRQLDSWGGGQFGLSSHHDVISIFEKPSG